VIAAYSKQYPGILPNRLKIKHAQTGSAFPVTRWKTNSGPSDPKRGTFPPRLPVRTELVVKAKGQPSTGHESPVVEHSYSSTLSLTSALDGVGNARPGRFTPGTHPVSIVQEAGWAPGPVWRVRKISPYTWIRSPDRPARSESLYRLRYPGIV
jgi:hypothetical protein